MKIIKLKFKYNINMDSYYIIVKDNIVQGYELSGPVENARINNIFVYLQKHNLIDTSYALEEYLDRHLSWNIQEIYELQGNDIEDWKEQLIHIRIAE